MSINWTKIVPRWSGDVIEPPEAKKNVGYIAGDKPPAKWENWLRKGTYEALEETRTVVEGIDSQLAQIDIDVTDLLNNKSIHSRGENANGNWIRFQDGTQICWAERTISFFEIGRLRTSWVFPSQFLDNKTVVLTTIKDAANISPLRTDLAIHDAESTTTTSTFLQLYRRTNGANFVSGDSCVMSAMAIGRWK